MISTLKTVSSRGLQLRRSCSTMASVKSAKHVFPSHSSTLKAALISSPSFNRTQTAKVPPPAAAMTSFPCAFLPDLVGYQYPFTRSSPYAFVLLFFLLLFLFMFALFFLSSFLLPWVSTLFFFSSYP